MNRIFRRLQNSDDGKGGGGGGGGADDGQPAPWFSDAHKEYVTTKGFKTGDDALTSLQNIEKLMGHEKAGRTVVLPKDDKDVEGIKSYRTKIGVPEKADGYELPVPKGDDGAFAKQASSWLHEAGVPKAAAQKLAGAWNEYVAKSIADGNTAIKAQMDKQLDGLKTEWAGEFDAKAEAARRFMKAAGWDDARVKMYEETFGTADMLKTFSALGAKLGGAEFIKGDGNGGGGAAAETAKKQIEELRAKRIANQIDDKTFHAEMQRLGPLAEKAA